MPNKIETEWFDTSIVVKEINGVREVINKIIISYDKIDTEQKINDSKAFNPLTEITKKSLEDDIKKVAKSIFEELRKGK